MTNDYQKTGSQTHLFSLIYNQFTGVFRMVIKFNMVGNKKVRSLGGDN